MSGCKQAKAARLSFSELGTSQCTETHGFCAGKAHRIRSSAAEPFLATNRLHKGAADALPLHWSLGGTNYKALADYTRSPSPTFRIAKLISLDPLPNALMAVSRNRLEKC